MRSRHLARGTFAVLALLAAFVVVSAYLSGAGAAGPTDTGRPAFDAPPSEGVTVVATDSNTWLGESGDGPRARAELVAFAPNGSVLYYDDTYTRYWDVDPVPNTTRTVEYVAAMHLDAAACNASTACTRNVVERVNLSTGERERVYARITPGKHATRWHDVDRLGPERIVVADIDQDRVYVANTTTGLVEWAWDAQSAYPLSSGGPYPEDWTHLNDVAVLENGTIMVSLRNQDQVVFLDRETGLLERRTLGAENRYDVLYEQHNPDYIPESEGGPAVLVADSENDRLVEYERSDPNSAGEWHWTRTWTWSDARTQWPRDADRLPNGHTLVTDSNGNRVLEVDEAGAVVWSVDVAFPYEAERLGTGDESTGGPAASQANLESRTGDGGAGSGEGDSGEGTDFESASDHGLLDRAWVVVEGLLPGRTANAVLYVTPVWMGGGEVLALAGLVLVILGWLVAEVYWFGRSASLEWPVRVSRRN